MTTSKTAAFHFTYCAGTILLVVALEVAGFTTCQHRPWRQSLLGYATSQTAPSVKHGDFMKNEIEQQIESMVLIDEKQSADNIGSTSFTTFETRQEVRPFPLSMIIDKQEVKHALLLSAVNPRFIGVIINGGRGTGKSVIARSMQRIIPSHISRIKRSSYNIDPRGRDGIDSFLLRQLENDQKSIESLEKEFIPTPFVQIPLGSMEDCLVGTIDLEKSLDTGSTVFSPGLLAKAHRGILYVDDINLLDDDVVDILLKVLSDGFVTVEREGLSVKYPCRPLMIATYNPEEGELREHLLDRFAVALSTDSRQLSVEDRVRAVENVIEFTGGTQHQSRVEAQKRLELAEKDEQRIRTSVELARMRMAKGVKITSDQVKYLCEEASRYCCEGHRGEIFAVELAKASAALSGREAVNSDDLRAAVILSILPRATVYSGEYDKDTSPDESSLPPPPPPSTSASQPPPIMEPPPVDANNEEQDDSEENDEEGDNSAEMEEDGADDDKNTPNEPTAIPDEFMVGVERVKVDPKLLQFPGFTRRGRGGKRAKMFSLLRGRFVKAIFPKAGSFAKCKLAIGATLRASAPHQLYRRKRFAGTKKHGRRKVIVQKDDFRVKRMSRKAGTLVIFLVDSSGSMALNRMNAAKGASIELLAQAYKSRDKIALISFHGERAEVLVPPTKSMALTKNRLESMPCGGGSPLAHALMVAAQVGLNTIKVKQDVGRVVIVCVTDGRANIPLELSEEHKFTPSSDPESKDGMPSRKFLKDEVLACSKRLASLPDFDVVVLDTEDNFVGTGIAQEMATAAAGKYFHLDKTDSASVGQITKQNL